MKNLADIFNKFLITISTTHLNALKAQRKLKRALMRLFLFSVSVFPRFTSHCDPQALRAKITAREREVAEKKNVCNEDR